ncbi:MAG TPA: hypothetical protein PLV68_03365, partial [Ilumatobacteraceae bacterium]|nr:hypothetical protein [Ilumatobacteraceae bacterium]
MRAWVRAAIGLVVALVGVMLAASLATVGAQAGDGQAAPAKVVAAVGDRERLDVVGDSLTARARSEHADAFAAVGWTSVAVDASSQRTIDMPTADDHRSGLDAVGRLQATHDASLWVVALGTNDARWNPPARYRDLIVAMLDRIGPGHLVVWVNVYLPAKPAL